MLSWNNFEVVTVCRTIEVHWHCHIHKILIRLLRSIGLYKTIYNEDCLKIQSQVNTDQSTLESF